MKIYFPKKTNNFICVVLIKYIQLETLALFQTLYQHQDELGEAEGRCDGRYVQEAAGRGRVQLCFKVSEEMFSGLKHSQGLIFKHSCK